MCATHGQILEHKQTAAKWSLYIYCCIMGVSPRLKGPHTGSPFWLPCKPSETDHARSVSSLFCWVNPTYTPLLFLLLSFHATFYKPGPQPCYTTGQGLAFPILGKQGPPPYPDPSLLARLPSNGMQCSLGFLQHNHKGRPMLIWNVDRALSFPTSFYFSCTFPMHSAATPLQAHTR